MAKFSDIERFLENKGITFKIVDLPSGARSVDDVVKLSGGQIREEEIIKTIIIKTKTSEFIGCILLGRDKVRDDFIERLATKEEVLKIARVEFGAVCPILLGIPIIIDQKVAALKRVNMGSGDLLKGLEMNLKDLLSALPSYTIEEIT